MSDPDGQNIDAHTPRTQDQATGTAQEVGLLSNTSIRLTMPVRGPVEGMWNILRFNWPMYAVGVVCVLIAVGLSAAPSVPDPARLALLLLAGLGLWWLVGSLVVSFWVYDMRQALDCWWAVPDAPTGLDRWVNIHSGLDNTSEAINFLFPQATGLALDIYDATLMPEPSITRARKLCPARYPQTRARFDALPVDTGSVDAVFLVFAAHELRTDAQREKLLAECHRVLGNGGRLFLAEHPRDMATFVAFGPGFMHFHSQGTWDRNLARAGFKSGKAFSVTPFASVWVCQK
jgi:SAM-dependent methyltransferase